MNNIKQLNIEDISDFIKRHNINFIGSAITLWHLYGVESCILYLQKQNKNIRPLILVQPLYASVFFIDQDKYCCSYEHVYTLIKKQSIFRSFNVLLKFIFLLRKNARQKKIKDTELFIVSPWEIDIILAADILKWTNQYKINYLYYDEGVSVYFDEKTLYKKRNNYITSIKENIMTRTCKDIYLTDAAQCMYLYIKENNKLVLNPQSYPYYKQIVTKNNESLLTHKDWSDYVIIATQCFRDKIDEDIEIIQKTVTFIKSINLIPIIKPHPREPDFEIKYKQMECDLLDNNITLEMILAAEKKPKIIISFISTVLITAKLFFNVPVISLVCLVNHELLQGITKIQFERFQVVFSNHIDMPKSFFELQESIEYIVNNN
jgi:hypothetical protein